MNWFDSFCAFDTETTGFGTTARILEIGVAQFRNGMLISTWSQLINPGNSVDWNDRKVQDALNINHITRADLSGKPSFAEILPELQTKLLNERIWVAHNASFDAQMLQQEFARVSLKYQDPDLMVCTLTLAKKLNRAYSGGNKLGEVASRYGVVQTGAHRADADAATCGRILVAMAQKKELPTEKTAMSKFGFRVA